MSDDNLFTRAELLSGQPQRRARMALFLIESQTARLTAQARSQMERFPSESAASERELRFLEAFSAGKEPPEKPSIQDLEQQAAGWEHLVPENPRLRAALAHLLGEKYRFTERDTPGLRRALGLNETEVRVAYSRLYGAPLEEIYAPRERPVERLRWAWTRLNQRLENLPPFWTAYALTLTETVGASILALPIALATVGPLPGVAILVIMGIINILTILYVTETLTRTASIRYGRAFFGGLVAEYLGRPGSVLFAASLLLLSFLVQIAYYTGFSTTLGDAFGIHPAIPCALLFLVTLFMLKRESLNATISMALIVGGFNILLVLGLSALALGHFRSEYFLTMNLPFIGGRPFDAALLQLVFGVVLAAYFGHTSTANCARVVLHRDESGRSLIWGGMAAQASAVILYSLFVIGLNSAVSPAVMAGLSGTALIPLADLSGPVVYLLGTVFVILGMGMASINFSLGAFNLVRERLPARYEPVVVLPRRKGKLVFSPRSPDAALPDSLGLVYLGLVQGQKRLRLDVQEGSRLRMVEREASGKLEAGALFREAGIAVQPPELAFEVLEASSNFLRLRLRTNLAVSYAGELDTAGIDPAGLLSLKTEEQWLLRQLLRRPDGNLGHILADTGRKESEVTPLLQDLIEKGLVRELPGKNGTMYSARFRQKRGRNLPEEIWSGLEGGDQRESGYGLSFRHTLRQGLEAFLDRGGRFWLCAAPVILIFLLVEWLIWTGAESFTGPLNFAGILIVSLLAGIFPCLLVLSSRRKGELMPGIVHRALAHPLVVGLVYLFSLANLLVHGLVIWEHPVQRLTALGMAVLIAVSTLAIYRRGAFNPRLVVELREDRRPGRRSWFSILAGGQPANGSILWGYPGGLLEQRAQAGSWPEISRLDLAVFDLSGLEGRELKVWAHRILPGGESQPLPARVEMNCLDGEVSRDLTLTEGQAIISLDEDSTPCRRELRVIFEQEGAVG